MSHTIQGNRAEAADYVENSQGNVLNTNDHYGPTINQNLGLESLRQTSQLHHKLPVKWIIAGGATVVIIAVVLGSVLGTLLPKHEAETQDGYVCRATFDVRLCQLTNIMAIQGLYLTNAISYTVFHAIYHT